VISSRGKENESEIASDWDVHYSDGTYSNMAMRVWSTARWIAGYHHGGHTNVGSNSAERTTESLVITNSNSQEESELGSSPNIHCDEDPSHDGLRANLHSDLKNTCASTGLFTWLECLVLASICIVVAVGFCIPVVVYITGADHSSGKLRAAINDFDFSNCSRTDREDQMQVSWPGHTDVANSLNNINVSRLFTALL